MTTIILKRTNGKMRKNHHIYYFYGNGMFEIKRVISGQFQISLIFVKPLKMCQQVYITFCGSTTTYPLTYCKIKWTLQQIQTPKYFI